MNICNLIRLNFSRHSWSSFSSYDRKNYDDVYFNPSSRGIHNIASSDHRSNNLNLIWFSRVPIAQFRTITRSKSLCYGPVNRNEHYTRDMLPWEYGHKIEVGKSIANEKWDFFEVRLYNLMQTYLHANNLLRLKLVFLHSKIV